MIGAKTNVSLWLLALSAVLSLKLSSKKEMTATPDYTACMSVTAAQETGQDPLSQHSSSSPAETIC